MGKFIKALHLNSQLQSYAVITGKSLSEALLFAEHGKNMLCTKIVLNVRNNFCTQQVLPRFKLGIFMYWTCNSMNNLSSYCGLVDAKIRASDKNLPVPTSSRLCPPHSKLVLTSTFFTFWWPYLFKVTFPLFCPRLSK